MIPVDASLDSFESFWPTFLGAVLGIPAGLVLASLTQFFADKRARIVLSQILRETLRAVLNDLDDKLPLALSRSENRFLVTLDLTVLEATAVRKYDLLPMECCRTIDVARFRLLSLNNGLKRAIDAELSFSDGSRSPSTADRLRSSLGEELPNIKEDVREAINSLTEIEKTWITRIYEFF